MAITSSLVRTASGSRMIREVRGRISSGMGVVAIRSSHQGLDRKLKLSAAEQRKLDEARRALKYPAVEFTGVQARAIGRGFANAVASSQFTIWACLILPWHVHLVIARHRYKVEQVVRLLKGAATKQLLEENLHPLMEYCTPTRR